MGNPLVYHGAAPSNDANEITDNGCWECGNNVLNMPENWCYLFVYRMSSSSFVVQIATNNENGGFYYRKRYNGNWLDWSKL